MVLRRTAFWAAALLGLASPAFAQGSNDYERGVTARLAGQTELAVELLGRAAAAEPANADAQLQYGLALLAAGRLDEAERAFRATLDLAPGYDDARIGLARIYQRRGDRAAALAELERVPSSNAEGAQLRATVKGRSGVASHFRWQADLDGSYSDVRGQSDWQDVSLGLSHWIAPSTRVGASIQQSHRFGRDDTYGEIRVDHRLSSITGAWLLFGSTPDADFRPRWQVGAGGFAKLTEGQAATVATIEGRHARYPSGSIDMVIPGVEQYLQGGHWITARMINVVEGGKWRTGWLARADVVAGDRLRLFAGVADSPDLNEGFVVETFSVFGGLVFELNQRTILRLAVNKEDRQGGADRVEFTTGLGLRF